MWTFSSYTIGSISKLPPLNSDYLTGLIDGDGSFNFGFKSARRRVEPNFTIVQGIEDKLILDEVKAYLGCGAVYLLKSKK